MKATATITENSFWQQSQIIETAILLGLSVTIPFLIHLVPVGGELHWGPMLLPMFYAPILAAYFCRIHVGVAVCFLAPLLNLLFTGRPTPVMAGIITAELLLFFLILQILRAKIGKWNWYFGLLAFLGVKAVFLILLLIWPSIPPAGMSISHLLNGIVFSAPGLALLGLIGWISIRCYPQE